MKDDADQLNRIAGLLEKNNELLEQTNRALASHNKVIRDIDDKLRKVTINTSNM